MTAWYPTSKTRPADGCPTYQDLDLVESGQVQEVWAIEGSVGPEIMVWLDGVFAYWWPCLTMERALKLIHGERS